MKLHLNKDVFKQFINKISSETNISVDILEKDYYVCCIPQELAKKQDELQAYFKGGTATYKILDTMNRFSEDIDLTVKVSEQLSKNQKKKSFERTAFDYNVEGLTLNEAKSIKNGKSETAFYDYETVFDIDTAPLQRAGEIQIKNEQELKRLVVYKREEEKIRTGGVSSDIKIKDFSYLKCNFDDEFIEKFNNMQDKYIINENYKIDMNQIKNTLQSIKEKFINIDI